MVGEVKRGDGLGRPRPPPASRVPVRPRDRPTRSPVSPAGSQAAHRGEGVAGDQARPDQLPQRVDVPRAIADRQPGRQQSVEEVGAAAGKGGEKLLAAKLRRLAAWPACGS